MDVTIIFVNYNTISLLNDAIDSVLENSYGFNYEIIVVDNASDDNSEQILYEKFKNDIVYIRLLENIGFGRANNEGIKVAKGRNIFLLNPDTLLMNNAIKILSDHLDLNSNVGVVGANLYNEDGSPQPSFSYVFPSLGFALSNLTHTLFLYNREVINISDTPLEVKRVVGAAMMIKREVIDKVGMFDSRFFMYAEEDEWCFRIIKCGYKIINVPLAKIIHLDGRSFQFSEHRKKRQLEGIRTFYRISYSSGYCTLIRIVEYLTIISRLIFSIGLKRKEDIEYWRFMYENRKWK